MSTPKDDSEKVIALAFLRTGHPRLAFLTVVMKSLPRVMIAAGLVFGGFSIGQSGAVPALVKALHIGM